MELGNDLVFVKLIGSALVNEVENASLQHIHGYIAPFEFLFWNVLVQVQSKGKFAKKMCPLKVLESKCLAMFEVLDESCLELLHLFWKVELKRLFVGPDDLVQNPHFKVRLMVSFQQIFLKVL